MATLVTGQEIEGLSAVETHRGYEQPLASVPLFRALPNAELDQLFSSSATQRAGRHQVVYCADEKLRHLYVVLNGSFKSVRHSEEGKELIVSLFGQGDCFGAFADSRDAATLVQALEDSTILLIPVTAIRRTIAKHTDFAIQLLGFADRRHQEAESAAARLAFETVPRRLARLLLEESDDGSGNLRFPLNQTEIANLIGSSRETVCSILNQFRRDGLLDIRRGKITVRNRAQLDSVR